jgi:hypothetical protein
VSPAAHAPRLLLAAGILLVVLTVTMPRPWRAPGAPPGSPSPAPGSSYTITLHNDTPFDGEFEAWVLGDYSRTTVTVGSISAGGSAPVTLPSGIGIESRYVFYQSFAIDDETGHQDASVTEARLAELGFVFRFQADHMGGVVVEPGQ